VSGHAVSRPQPGHPLIQAPAGDHGRHGCPLCGCPPRMHPARPSRRAELLVAWLADHYARPSLRSADMAQAIGLSVRALEATCQREFGRTPHQLLTGIRLQRAHLLLTGLGSAPPSLAEAAASVGFRRVSRFTAAYRRRYPGAPATGASPARPPVTLTGADPARTPDMITTGELSCFHAEGRPDAQEQ
jgi:AraC-like DNA-binding protein